MEQIHKENRNLFPFVQRLLVGRIYKANVNILPINFGMSDSLLKQAISSNKKTQD